MRTPPIRCAVLFFFMRNNKITSALEKIKSAVVKLIADSKCILRANRSGMCGDCATFFYYSVDSWSSSLFNFFESIVMIEKTGGGLQVVIATKSGLDWQTFACWYSLHKSLPDAEVVIVINRTTTVDWQYYQWAKRLRVPHIFQNAVFERQHAHYLQTASLCATDTLGTLVVSPWVMFVNPLNDHLHELFNDDMHVHTYDAHCMFLRYRGTQAFNKAIDDVMLGVSTATESLIAHEAKDHSDPWPIISNYKGCGKWIHTMKGCPFSSATGMTGHDMTCNEWKIIEQWRRMVPLYNAVS